MLNSHKTHNHQKYRPSKVRQLCSLGYECITTAALALAIGFVTTAIIGSADIVVLRSVVGSTIIFGVWAYYVLCWCTSGQSLAQKSWGLKITNKSENRLTVILASARLVLCAAFNGTLIGPALLLITKDNQLPQDKLLGTKVMFTERKA